MSLIAAICTNMGADSWLDDCVAVCAPPLAGTRAGVAPSAISAA
jgi:hypothetical protein